ncbi:MAG: hypothetical protein PHS50_15510, partial [Kiritimatiellae bacterium]|nr:hypothetical protein [Kiritimatiellia bacterium]
IPSLHISGGQLTSTTNNWSDSISVGHHVNGYGLLTLSGGLLSNTCMTVGYEGIGVVTNAGGTVDLGSPGLLLGRNASGRGTYVQESGAFTGELSVGHMGTGVLVYAGGSIASWGHVYVGRHIGSEGLLDVRAPGINVGGGQTLFIGYSGRGILEQRANLSADYLKIGGNPDVTSVATIYAGTTNTAVHSCNVGGYPVWSQGGIEEIIGDGVLVLKGGVLHISNVSLQERLYVGRYTGSHGRIQGWGRISHPSSGTTNIRLVLGEGVIQADGEGEARTLDLNEIVSTSNSVPNGATGTNGWYAVNKGRVLFPRTWFDNSSGTQARCMGDWHGNPAPGLVNSVHATFTGITLSANFWRGGVYAPDRDDIPAGLPTDAEPIGIWQLGLYRDLSSWTADQAAPFTTVTLTFRYDQTRVGSSDHLVLYRHTTSGWSRVETVVSSDHCVTTAAPLARLTNADANIGWFALVTQQRGTLVTVR